MDSSVNDMQQATAELAIAPNDASELVPLPSSVLRLQHEIRSTRLPSSLDSSALRVL